MGALQTVAVLGMLPLGVVGMARLARPLKSQRARLMVVITYAAVPLPYDCFAFGRFDGLICYGLAPFIMSRILRAHGAAPYVGRRCALHLSLRRTPGGDEEDLDKLVVSDGERSKDDLDATALHDVHHLRREHRLVEAAGMLEARTEGSVPAHSATSSSSLASEPLQDRLWFLFVRHVAPLALLLAVAGSFAPQILVASFIVAVATAIGGFVTGERDSYRFRAIGVTFVACGVALLVLLPGILGASSGWQHLYKSFPGPGARSSNGETFDTLLRLGTGDFVASIFTFGLLLAALPATLVGRSWRLSLSLSLWIVTVSCIGLTWLGARGWLGDVVPDPHVFLALAGVSLALNAGLGAVAVQEDLSTFRFGWRQLLPIVAVAGAVGAIVPTAARAGNGSWNTPGVSATELLSWMPEQRDAGSFRVLWLGDARGMPGGARRFSDDLGAAIAVDGPAPQGPALPDNGGMAEKALANIVATARRDDTIALGHLLAPYSVRYIVVPQRTGSAQNLNIPIPPPPDVISALADQLDLRSVESDESLVVYENAAWTAGRGHLSHRVSAPILLAQVLDAVAWVALLVLALKYRMRRGWYS